MASILRSYVINQRRQCLKELTSLSHNVIGATNKSNIKRLAAPLCIRQFSTKDQKSEDRSLIYQGNLAKQIRNLKTFSLFSSTGGLVFQPFVYMRALEADNTMTLMGISAFIGLFAIASPIILHFVTKKYVCNLYYDSKENKYIAEIYTILVNKQQIEFTPDDVKVPDVTGMFTTCIVKGIPLFFDERFFNEPSHYIKIMGYDKPIDFKLGNINNEDPVFVKNDKHEGGNNKERV